MNLRNKIYQMFMLAPQSVRLEEDDNLANALTLGLGGVIFFTKNIVSFDQTKTFTSKIKKSALLPPFIGIDEEGGRVERTENIFGGKKFLSARYQAENGIEFVENQTNEIAQLLGQLGFNMNFAPVLDVDTNPLNPIIAERAYGKTPAEVEKYGFCAMKTYLKNNIIPVGKHFPGHGDVDCDSHLTLPTVNLSLEEMEKTHIRPFKTAILEKIPAIMAAHVYCPYFDNEKIPASLSGSVLSYLRTKLNFEGLIVSDDMQMGGVKIYSPQDAVLQGIEAGINLFLYRDSSDEIISLIENTIVAVEKDETLVKNVEKSFEIIQKVKKNFLLT